MGKIISINPSTEETVFEFEETKPEEITQIVKNSKKSSEKWKNYSVKERCRILKPLFPWLEKNKDKIAKLITQEMGKPLKDSYEEIKSTSDKINFFLENNPKYLKDEIIDETESEKSIVAYEPIGIIGVIISWNSPFELPFWFSIPALISGNCVICKPSEYTSKIGLKVKEAFDQLDIPENVFNMILGAESVGEELVKQNVDMISFIGSIKTGKKIAKDSADKLHRLVLELGGKHAATVCEDANIDLAVESIVHAATRNTGQVCCSVERIYVEEKVYSEFLDKVLQRVKKIKIGDGFEKDINIGPFVAEFQLKKVEKHLKDAVEKGANILYGGKRIGNKGFFFEPTVITELNNNMKIIKEETFGPVIPITKVKNVDEAVKLTNSLNFGLSDSVFTKDSQKALEIAKKINSGSVGLNLCSRSKTGCPWGGNKQSGWGRMLSAENVREFTNKKHIWINKI